MSKKQNNAYPNNGAITFYGEEKIRGRFAQRTRSPVLAQRAVANAGVLLALPALLSNGLLRQIGKYFVLPPGYYTLQQIFLVIAFLALCRIKSLEQLRYCAPGEWGKVQ